MPNLQKEGDPSPSSATKTAGTPAAAGAPTYGAKKRYHSILRDFMAYTNEVEVYPDRHMFTNEELSAITPGQIIRYFKYKLYGDGDVNVSDKPLSGSHHTLDYYKKAISSFAPQREVPWDPVTRQGNPTRAKSINEFVRHIRDLESVEGSSKKRKNKTGNSTPSKQSSTTTTTASKPSAAAAAPAAKKARGPELPGGINNPNAIMSEIFLQVHQQNNSIIDWLGDLGTMVERFRSGMKTKNQTIMSNIHRLNSSLEYFNAYAPGPPIMRFATVGAGVTAMQVGPAGVAAMPGAAAAMPAGPGVAAAAMSRPGVTAMPRLPTTSTRTYSLHAKPKPPVPNKDWSYLHPDGELRSVPPGWQFPNGNLFELYTLWHIGDTANRIHPMKTFSALDVAMCGKRGRTTLSEARCLVAALDREVRKAGGSIGPNVSEAELFELFKLGIVGLDISRTTPTGRGRNINSLKWTTLVELGRTPKEKKSMVDDGLV